MPTGKKRLPGVLDTGESFFYLLASLNSFLKGQSHEIAAKLEKDTHMYILTD